MARVLTNRGLGTTRKEEVTAINPNIEVRDWYNRKAGIHLEKRWFKTAAHRWDYMVTRRALLDELRPSPSDVILEIGCGPGTWTAEVAPSCRHLVAVDIAEDMIAQAQRYTEGLDIEFVCSDFLNCDLSGRFDKIFSVRAIEYIRDKDGVAARVAELLAPGGKVVIITKNRLSVWRGRYRVLDLIDSLVPRPKNAGDDQQEDKAPAKHMVSHGEAAKMFAAQGLTEVGARPVVARMPIFRGGFREYPIVPQAAAPPVLKLFELFFGFCSAGPNWFRILTLFLAESYCMTLTKGNT